MLKSQKTKLSKKDLRDIERKQAANQSEREKQPDEDCFAPAKFFPAKNIVLLHTASDIHVTPCNVYSDGTLSYEIPKFLRNTKGFKDEYGEIKKIESVNIRTKPSVLEIPFRRTNPTWLGRRLSPEYVRFLAYNVIPGKGVTIDPVNDFENLKAHEVLEGLKALLQLKARILKVNWKTELAKGMLPKKGWSDFIWPIVLIIQDVIFLLFFVLVPELG